MKRAEFIGNFIGATDGLHILTGGAGTGKSRCIIDILKQLPPSLDVAVITPTHSAKNRLKEEGVNCDTIDKLLKNTVITDLFADSAGDAERVESNAVRDNYDIIIVDEYSMASFDKLATVAGLCNKLLLVGDSAQLPPVKAKGVDIDELIKASVNYYDLTINYRAATDSLVSLYGKVRDTGILEPTLSIEELTELFLLDEKADKVYLAHSNADCDRVSKLLNTEVTTGNYYLAHTPFKFWSTTTAYNDEIYNGDKLRIEKILTADPLSPSKGRTSFTCYVKGLGKDSKYCRIKFKDCDIPFVHCYLGSASEYRKIYVEPTYKELQRVATQILQFHALGTPSSKTSKLVWDMYNEEKLHPDEKAMLKRAYSAYKTASGVLCMTDARVSTVHKAQGLGFDNVYINTFRMSDKLKYVAVTRAKNKVEVAYANIEELI